MVLHLSFVFWQSWQMREETCHFCQIPDDLAKADRSLLLRGFWSPTCLRLLFAPYRGNFHRNISRHKVLIHLRLLFATQSLTARRRPPREETPPHAPSSPTFFLKVNAPTQTEGGGSAKQRAEERARLPVRRSGRREEKKRVKK